MTTTRPFVLACGGRGYGIAGRDAPLERVVAAANERATVRSTLTTLAPAYVLEGGAHGADGFAADWRQAAGVAGRSMPADWARHGDRAGRIRNAEMLSFAVIEAARLGLPLVVVAFPGGPGTRNMCMQAEHAGVEVFRVGWKKEEDLGSAFDPDAVEL